MDNSGQNPSSRTAVIKVVIVDDDMLVRSMLTKLLSSYPDLRVTDSYADGMEALESVRAVPPDVMLVDVSMPNGIGGAELTQMVRLCAPSVQILALTSLTNDETVSEMLHAGALGFLFKDSSHEAIADAIRAARSGLSVLSPRARDRLATPRRPADTPELSETEGRILRLVADGLTNDQIAKQVYLSVATVKYHIGILTRKLEVTNRVTLAVRASQLRLL